MAPSGKKRGKDHCASTLCIKIWLLHMRTEAHMHMHIHIHMHMRMHMCMYMRMHIYMHRKNNVDSEYIVLTQRIELTQKVWCWLFEYSVDLEAMRKKIFDLCFCILYAPLHMFIYEVTDLRIDYLTWTAKPSSISLFRICADWIHKFFFIKFENFIDFDFFLLPRF